RDQTPDQDRRGHELTEVHGRPGPAARVRGEHGRMVVRDPTRVELGDHDGEELPAEQQRRGHDRRRAVGHADVHGVFLVRRPRGGRGGSPGAPRPAAARAWQEGGESRSAVPRLGPGTGGGGPWPTRERALYGLDRWDRQQEYYTPGREERFAVIVDVVQEVV